MGSAIRLSLLQEEGFSIKGQADISGFIREVTIMEKSIKIKSFSGLRHLSDINPPPYFSTQSRTVGYCSRPLPLSAGGAQRRIR